MNSNQVIKESLVVIKVGTNLLTTSEGKLDLNNLRGICDQISSLMNDGKFRFLIVTSGSIICGSEHLSIEAVTIPEKQAAASVGQTLLMQAYAGFFSQYAYNIGQILLTKEGLRDTTRKQHAKNTICTLLDQGIIPIINENDSVSTSEIDESFTDNDQLAGEVATLVLPNWLILLSDVDGVYSKNPKIHTDAKKIDLISDVDEAIVSLAEDTPSRRNRGGMSSKLRTAGIASRHGIHVEIADGRGKDIIRRILEGHHPGTFIPAKTLGGKK